MSITSHSFSYEIPSIWVDRWLCCVSNKGFQAGCGMRPPLYCDMAAALLASAARERQGYQCLVYSV